MINNILFYNNVYKEKMFTIEIEDGREAPSFFIASVSSSFINGCYIDNSFKFGCSKC